MVRSRFKIVNQLEDFSRDGDKRVFSKPLPVHHLPASLSKFNPEVAEFATKEYNLASRGYSAVYLENITLLLWKWEDKPNSDFVCIPIFDSRYCMLSTYWAQYYRFGTLSPTLDEFSLSFSLYDTPSLTLEGSYLFLGGHDTFTHWVADHLGVALHLAPLSKKGKFPFLCFNLRDWQSDFLSNLSPDAQLFNIDLSAFPPGPTRLVVEGLWLMDYIDIANRQWIVRNAVAEVAMREGLRQEKPISNIYYLERSNPSSNKPKRVLNAFDLQRVVKDLGGIVVDPAALGFIDKIRYFFIGDAIFVNEPGSGETNFSFFSSIGSKLVQLIHPEVLSNPNHHAINAGWKYILPRLDSISFLTGNQLDPQNGRLDYYLDGAEYSPRDLERLLHELLAGVKS